MTRTRVVLLGMLVLIAAGYGMQAHTARAAETPEARHTPPPPRQWQAPLPPQMIQRMAPATKRVAEKLRRDAIGRVLMPPVPDSLLQEVPYGYQLPNSEWQAREKSTHRKLLERGHFDALVLPFQVMGAAFDRPTRSLMTAELTRAVHRSTQWRLPDPYLVAKALGDGARQLNVKDVFELADVLGVQHIFFGYAGHNEKGLMNVAVRRMDRLIKEPVPEPWTAWDPVGSAAAGEIYGIPLRPGAAPIERFVSRMPDMIAALELGFAEETTIKSAQLNLRGLGETPASLMTRQDNPANDAYAFLLYAALVPRGMERQKEVFAEQAYLALDRLAKTAPEYRVLRARTLLTLGSREEALQVLATPASHEERGLFAYANGNLTELQEAAKQEKHPIKRLLLKIDENRLATSYQLRNPKQAWAGAEGMRLPGRYWPHLVGRAFLDTETWAQFDNALVKHLMDVSYPIKGFVLEKMVKGLMSLGDKAKLQALVDRSFIDHAHKLHEAEPTRWCCRDAPGQLGPPDYLALLLSIGHDNLLRRIPFYANTQGDGAGALAFANSLELIYKGFPYFELGRAYAELAYAKAANVSEQERLRKSAQQRGFGVMHWERGQSWVSDGAVNLAKSLVRTGDARHGDIYRADLPRRPYYRTQSEYRDREVEIRNSAAALSNSTSEFYLVSRLYDLYKGASMKDTRIAQLMQSIDGRFNGAPQKNGFLADMALDRGDRRAAKAFFRSNAQTFPGYWPSIRQWGWLLYEDGEVNEAARIWASYAGFQKDSNEGRVDIANEAYEVGSALYWSGHLDLAEPFYRISAAQNAGAASDISSATRLRLVAGDLGGVLSGLQQRAQRYRDTYAYRDYLGLLHAAGRSDEAWAGFSSILRDMPQDPHVWETAMVGHRRTKVSDGALVAWAGRQEHAPTGPDGNAGAVYLLRFATTDRMPSTEVIDAIHQLDRPSWQLQLPSKQVARLSMDGRFASILGPDSNWGRAALELEVFKSTKKQRARSNLALFAEGYRALKQRNWKAATVVFDDAAALYDLNAQAGFMLPYVVYTQVQAGSQQAAEELLARLHPQGFDYFLARAALESAKGHRDEAYKFVTRARYARPHTEGRPLLTQYTFGDFVELLFEQSGDPRLRDLALSWAQVFQKIEPWQSWSYAIEARLGKTEADRGKAMAMTHYLDPESERLSRVKRQDVERAVKVWGTAQPFVLERSQPSGRPEKI